MKKNETETDGENEKTQTYASAPIPNGTPRSLKWALVLLPVENGGIDSRGILSCHGMIIFLTNYGGIITDGLLRI